MAVVHRGVKNAFRNMIRTVSITAILALTISLALVMLLSKQAVEKKIENVQGSVGTTITVSPAGARGFAGGGDPLTTDDATTIAKTKHVAAVASTLTDRLGTEGTDAPNFPGGNDNTNTTTNLASSIEPGTLGQRFGGGTTQGPANGATFTLPITVTGTTEPTSSEVAGVSSFKLVDGQTIDGKSSDNVALVGKDLATKNSLTVGSTFSAYGQTITVAGIFDTGNTFTNGGIIMPLATVQTLSQQTGAVTAVLAKVDKVDNVSATTTALQKKLADKADVVSDDSNSADTISSLTNVKTIATYSLIGALVAGAVIIFLSMVMIVRERRREIGVLKAVGSPNSKISFQFMTEALTLTLMAAVVGVLAGIVLSNPVLDVMVTNSNKSSNAAAAPTGRFGGPIAFGRGGTGSAAGQIPRFAAGNGITRGVTNFGSTLSNVKAAIGLNVLLYGLLAAAVIAIIGSSIPSYLIAKIRPAEVMRNE